MTTILQRASARIAAFKLDKPVGGSGVAAVDVLVVEITDSDGASGLGFSYVLGGGAAAVLAASQDQIEKNVKGKTLSPPQAIWRRVASGFNRTGYGPNIIALAALDVALWDLWAKRQSQPLYAAMGGEARAVDVYGSGYFNPAQSPQQAVDAALPQIARGLKAIKPRVKGARSDAALLEAVRKAIPDAVHIMTDANEKCDLASARWLLACARDQGLLFVEEPMPAYAIDGYRALNAAEPGLVASGEHLQGRHSFMPFVSERLVNTIQPDLAMIGGLTPCLELAATADAFDIALSPHFLPGLFVHLACATPAVKWIEEFPLLEPMFEGWPDIDANGQMKPRDSAGHGLTLIKAYAA
jgi:L-alanine-DL-glutamate epimerase-like enolase superfamily enzyme